MNSYAPLYKNILAVLAVLLLFTACHKDNELAPGVTPPPVDPVVVKVNDPAAEATQGFFLDDWQPKLLHIIDYADAPKPDGAADATIEIDPTQVVTKVSPYLFGNNINPYMTQVVTEPVLIDHLNRLSPRIIRAPGGSLTDLYFWNATDQRPADVPLQILDAQGNKQDSLIYWFGKNTAAWTLSVDNYYKTLQLTGSTGLITINYGYARYGTGDHPDQIAAHAAAEWVRYDKGRTKFWEIGNENYGIWEAGYRIDLAKNKDGQPEYLTGALYGKHFKVFVDSMRKAADEVGANIRIGAVMNTTEGTGGGVEIANWNRDVLAQIGNAADFYVVHDYYTPYLENSTIATIMNTADGETATVMNFIKSSTSSYPKPIAMSEWNNQAKGSNQAVSNITGLHAAMTFGELIRNKFGEASRFNLANNWSGGDDMGLFNIGDEPGAVKWAPRPAFYYQYYFKQFFGDRMVTSTLNGSADLRAYASLFSSGQSGAVIINKGAANHTATISLKNFTPGTRYYYYVLNGGTEATFSRKVFVNGIGPSGVSGGPESFQNIKPWAGAVSDGITVTVPAYGAVYLLAEGK